MHARVGGIVLLGALAGCGADGPVPPVVDAERVLAPTALSSLPPPPLAVISAGPRAEVGVNSQIRVMFNTPMRELSVAEAAVAVPIRITPQPAGQWEWVGTHALVFVPRDGALAPATEYQVEVDASATNIHGDALDEPYRFSLTTERPRLRNVDGSDFPLQEDSTLELSFNLPIDPQALAAHARLQVQPHGEPLQTIDLEASVPEVREPTRLRLTPREPLPKHASVTLLVDAQLRSPLGPLPLGEAASWDLETYGPQSARIDCEENDESPGECHASWWPVVILANPVKRSELRRAITIQPPVTLERDDDQDEETSYFQLRGSFTPKQRYSIRVGTGFRDAHGQALTAPVERELVFSHRVPMAALGLEEGLLPAHHLAPVPLSSVNRDSITLLTHALSPAELRRFDVASERIPLLAQLGPKSRIITPKAPKDRVTSESLRLERELPKGRGVLAVQLDEQEPKYVNITDLALNAHTTGRNALFWVTDLARRQPQANVAVSLDLGDTHYAGTSDADGVVLVEPGALSPFRRGADELTDLYAVAAAGADWTFTRLALQHGPLKLEQEQLLFTERGIYRPGEQVHVKGVLRRQTQLATRPEANVSFDLILRARHEVSRQRITTNRHGTYAAVFELPPAAPLGDWEIVSEGLESDGSVGFRVGEYRPTEIDADADARQDAYTLGDTLGFDVSGKYLFGAPMKGVPLRYTLELESAYFRPRGSDGFDIDRWIWGEGALPQLTTSDGTRVADVETEGSVSLDASGAAEVTWRPPVAQLPGPMRVELVAVLDDVTRQQGSAVTSALLHPGELYVGLRLPDEVLPHSTLRPEVAAFDHDGTRLPGRAVALRLFEARATNDAQPADPDSDAGDEALQLEEIASCELTTNATTVSCPMRVRAEGTYVLLGSSRDGRDNVVEAASSFRVGERRWRLRHDREERSTEPAIELDADEYRVGDTMIASITAPYPRGRVLVTVERDAIHWHRVVTLKDGAARVEIPVLAEAGPNATVAATFAAPLEHTEYGRWNARSQQHPRAATTYSLDSEVHRLAVKVAVDSPEHRPGDDVAVVLEVTDAEGRPARAEVTLYAVDDGVLSLTGYREPDLLPFFSRWRDGDVMHFDNLAQLATIAKEKELEGMLGQGYGSGHGRLGRSHRARPPTVRGGSSEARRDFSTTAYFNPSLETDAQGRASARFRLPDSLTSYRVMAVAVADDHGFGHGHSSVRTSLPLMARPAVPRFFRVGDSGRVSVVITSRQAQPVQAEVRAQLSGLTLKGADHQTVTVAPRSSVEVAFDVAASAPGTARLRFDVMAGEQRDAFEIERPVSQPISMETVALYGATRAAAGERLGDFNALRPDVGQLEVKLASTALVGIDTSLDALVVYPHGCTEQLASRLLPLLPLRELAADFGVELPADSDAIVAATVLQILSRQSSDGGFLLWPDSPRPSVWASAYALRALHEAKRRGVEVPASALDEGAAFLRHWTESASPDVLYLAQAAFIASVLAELGEVPPELLDRLWGERRELPVFGHALLLQAAVTAQATLPPVWGERRTVLRHELEGALHITGNRAAVVEDLDPAYGQIFDSNTRASAIVLRALVALEPNHPLADDLARGLLAAREGGSWSSTQETAFSLLALDDYRRAAESDVPDFAATLWLGDRSLASRRFEGRSAADQRLSIPMAQLLGKNRPGASEADSRTLAFQKEGTGTLFYEARLTYAQTELPTAPLSRGFDLRVGLHAIGRDGAQEAVRQGVAPSQASFSAGQTILGDVHVMTPTPREHVVIEVPVAAGLEPIDTSLATESGFRDLRDGADTLWHRRELRDDRVVYYLEHMPAGAHRFRFLMRATGLGHFVIPPAQITEMYAPETFGRTGARVIDVR